MQIHKGCWCCRNCEFNQCWCPNEKWVGRVIEEKCSQKEEWTKRNKIVLAVIQKSEKCAGLDKILFPVFRTCIYAMIFFFFVNVNL